MRRFLAISILTFTVAVSAGAQVASKASDSKAAPAAPATPSADEILRRYVNAIGGQEAWRKLNSRISTGTIEVPSMHLTGTVEMHEKAPNKMLATLDIGGQTYRQGYDGKTGWTDDPRDGLREQSGAELAETQRDSDFYHPLDLHELYKKLVVSGAEKIGEHQTFVVEATPPEGEADKLYFDADTGLVLRIISRHHMPEGVVVFQEDLSDYRQVDGVKLPFTIRQSSAESEFTIQFTEVHHNAPLEDGQFAKPAPSQ